MQEEKIEPISPEEEKEQEQRIRLARIGLRQDVPYLMFAITRMPLVKSYKVPTMGVDAGWRCYWNPTTVKNWTTQEIKWVLIHEVSHLLRNHAKRAMPIHFVDNVAKDMEINDDLTFNNNNGPIAPKNCYLPETMKFPDKLSAEEYYVMLMENKVKFINKYGKTMKMKGFDKNGQPEFEDGGEEHEKNSYGGSAADGKKRDWEEGNGPNDTPAVSEAEGNSIRIRVAEEISRQPGTLPGDWQRWAQGIINPKVDWRPQFRNLISQSLNTIRGHLFRSYKVVHRRQHPEFILPGYVSPIPRITIIIDTSGSMGNEELLGALSETQGVLRSVPTGNITVVTGDTQSASKQNVRNLNQVKMIGGGGTDMGNLIEENCEDTDLIIVMTDGDTPWCNKVKPRVIVCLFRDNEVPSWMKCIRVK